MRVGQVRAEQFVGRLPLTSLALACLFAFLALIAARWSTPSDGTVVQLSNEVWRSDRLRVDSLLVRGSALRVGDVVVGVDGRSLAELAAEPRIGQRDNLRVGSRHVYAVVRGDRTVQVPVDVGAFPVATFVLRSWPTELLLLLLGSVAVYVYLQRPGDPAARALLASAALLWPGAYGWLLGSQVATLAFAGPPPYLLLSEIPLAVVWGVVLAFVLAFPGGPAWAQRSGVRVLGLSLPVALYASYLALVLPGASRADAVGRLLQVSYPSSTVLPLASALLFAVVYLQIDDAHARDRARWIGLALALAAVLWFAVWTLPISLGRSAPDPGYVALVILPCPVAVGVAVLRWRLFDLDPMRRRLLIRAAAASVVVLFAVLLAWWATLLGLGRETFGNLLVAAVVAVVAPPMSSRIRSALGRRALGSRDEPHVVVTSLGRSRDVTSVHEQLAQLASTLAAALKLDFVAVRLDGPGERSRHASSGVDRGAGLRLPLEYGSQVVGTLVLDAGPHRDPLGPADEPLLETVRGHVSTLAYSVLANERLQTAREQLVVSREDQRRALHNRLHDGLGSSLAATRMKAESAARLLASDPQRSKALLADVVADCSEMLGELRDVVLDLRPPALAQLGLSGAITERGLRLAGGARSDGAPLEVTVEEVGAGAQPPAAVEVAAYWIAVEAINNAVRHADARHCRITLEWCARPRPVLDLVVVDDGIGVPSQMTTGGGTLSMTDRAEELGGRLVIGRTPTGGTFVRATLPLLLPSEDPRG